jgi:hypothetical protein
MIVDANSGIGKKLTPYGIPFSLNNTFKLLKE